LRSAGDICCVPTAIGIAVLPYYSVHNAKVDGGGTVVLAENAWWLILLFFAVIVVKVIADVRKAMRLSEKQWQQVDKSKLQTWDDDEQ
jgi:hypothetical protein